MDTRHKILSGDVPAGAVVVTGYFDVLRAEHVRDLERIRREHPSGALIVMVLPLADEVLPQRARAELAAGLRMVDYVVTPDYGDLDGLIASLAPAAVVRLERDDSRRIRELREHVQQRQTR